VAALYTTLIMGPAYQQFRLEFFFVLDSSSVQLTFLGCPVNMSGSFSDCSPAPHTPQLNPFILQKQLASEVGGGTHRPPWAREILPP